MFAFRNVVSRVPSISHPYASLLVIPARRSSSSTPSSTSGNTSNASGLQAMKRKLLFENGHGGDSAQSIDAELAWEAEGLQIFSVHTSMEDKARAQKTQAFLRVLLTTPDEQEWRDMLTAAVRLGTWKPHHMEAALRGIHHTQEAPSPREHSAEREVSSAPSAASARKARQTHVSTPSQRLQRVKHIVQFWWELAAEQEVAASLVRNDSDETTTRDSLKPSEVQVYHVLVQLVRGAQSRHGHTPTATATSPEGANTDEESDTTASTPLSVDVSPPSRALVAPENAPQCSYADVWRFLAWMEQHDYHLMSTSLIPDLEAAVDAEEDAPSSQHAAQGGSTRTTTAADPSHYATISRRVNRLDYLKSEREQTQKRARETQLKTDERASEKGVTVPAYGGGRVTRRHEQPRTEPAT